MDDKPGGAKLSLSLDSGKVADLEGYFESLHPELISYVCSVLSQSKVIREGERFAFASDCVQEAFIRLVQMMRLGEKPFLAEPSDPNHVKSWLKVVTYHIVVDHIRPLIRHPETELQDTHRTYSGIEDSLVESALVDEYLARLDPIDEAILRLKYEWKFRSAEIAEMLGLPSANAVRTRMKRAIVRLAELLGAESHESDESHESHDAGG
jgi:RNA polymerase sigma factor (sigma-70 family)